MINTYSKIMRGAIAVLFLTISNALSSIVDSAFVGHFLGEKELAATGMCASVYSFCAVISGLCTYGIGVAIFKLIGSGKADKGNQYFTSVFVFSGIFTTLILIFMLTFSEPISCFIAAGTEDKELLQLVKDFYTGLFTGIVFLVLFSVIMPITELNNKNKALTISIIVSLIVNIFFDYLSIIYDFGLLGIGLSSSLSNLAILIVLLTTVIGKDKTVRLHFRKLKIQYLLEVVSCGFPYAFKRIANIVNRLAYNYFIIAIGSTSLLAGFSGMLTTRQLALSFGIGLGSSTSIIISYYVGLRDQKSADYYLKSTVRLSIIVCSLIGAATIFASPLISMIFSPWATEAFWYDVGFTCVLGVSVPISALIEIYLGYLLAINKKLATNAFMICERAVLPVISLCILSLLFGDYGIISTILISEVLALILIKIYIYVMKKTEYMRKLFKAEHSLYLKITKASEIEIALNKAEQFLEKCNIAKRFSLTVRLCLEEIMQYTVSAGFRDDENNYIETTILVNRSNLLLNINDNCNDYNLFNNISEVMAENATNLVGIKLVVEMCDSVNQMEFLGANNIQIKISNNAVKRSLG